MVEADQESVIANLVVSGVGLSLIREELALGKEAAGEVCLWRDLRLETTLWFIYQFARHDDLIIRSLLGVLRDTWKLGEDQALPPRQRPRTLPPAMRRMGRARARDRAAPARWQY